MIVLRVSLRLVVALGVCAAMSGCMAVALAPLVPLVSGTGGENNKVSIDQSTVTPDLRNAFATSKNMTVLGSDAVVIYMAQYLDEKGAFEVRTAEMVKGATPSQRREQMRNLCADKTSTTQLVISPGAAEVDAGGTSTAAAIFLGRARSNITSTVETLRCSDGNAMRFRMQAKLDQGVYNMDQSKIDQVIGQEAAKALMRLAGKLPELPQQP